MTTFTLAAQGSTPFIIINDIQQAPTLPSRVTGLNPGIIVNLSSGASLTYTVQVTGDDILSNPSYASSYAAASGVFGTWNPFDGMSGLTASANGTLVGKVTAIRCTITSYTSGTLTFQVTQ